MIPDPWQPGETSRHRKWLGIRRRRRSKSRG